MPTLRGGVPTMEEFKNSDSPELLAAELERCGNQVQVHVAELLTSPAPEAPLREALRETHTLHGLATSIHAWGLAGLGADFNKLLEMAGAWWPADREKATEIFQFILDRQQDWFVMNQFTSMEMLSEAWDIYQGLRVMMEERWPGCLPPVQSEIAAAVPVALTEASELPLPAEEASIIDAVPELEIPPALSVAQPSPTLAPTDALTKHAEFNSENRFKPVTPWLLRVMPPTLRHSESSAPPCRMIARETNRDVRQDALIVQKANPVKAIPPPVTAPDPRRANSAKAALNLPARPWLLPVVPPTLRYAEVRTV